LIDRTWRGRSGLVAAAVLHPFLATDQLVSFLLQEDDERWNGELWLSILAGQVPGVYIGGQVLHRPSGTFLPADKNPTNPLRTRKAEGRREAKGRAVRN
jgi:hypothetical protein